MLWQHWRISWHFQITTGIKSAIHGASTSGFIKFRNTLMYNTKQDLLGVHCIALSSFCWLAIRCSNVFLWAMQQLAAGRWTSKVATNVGYLASIRSRHNKVLPCIATSCLHLSKHGGDSGGRPNLTKKYFISRDEILRARRWHGEKYRGAPLAESFSSGIGKDCSVPAPPHRNVKS